MVSRDGVGSAVDLQRHVGTEGGGHAVALAGGGGPHHHAAGEGEGGGNVRLFHVGFLSFSAVQAALVCASDYEMHGTGVLLRGRKNFLFFSPARARAAAVRLDLTITVTITFFYDFYYYPLRRG